MPSLTDILPQTMLGTATNYTQFLSKLDAHSLWRPSAGVQ
jgi:hypothetical protein